MDRTLYASDGIYFLYPLVEEDRKNYVMLHKQINGENTLFLNPVCKDLMWEEALTGETKIYSIYDVNEKYCGSIEVQKPLEKQPEIGIDLLIECRNKGIAPQVVKLLAEEFYSQNDIEYFLIRISSKNLHSKHVFEKMGAMFIGKEENQYQTFIKSFKEIIGDQDISNIEEKLKEKFDVAGDIEEEVVYRYKYIPEVFLKK